MKHLRKAAMLIILLIIIVSCKKDDSDTYPKKYVFNNIVYGEVNTHTNSGDKNDIGNINSFLENFPINYGTGYLYGWSGSASLLNIYEEQSANIPFKLHDEIELLSESTAKITSNDTIIYFDLIRKNGILYFQSLDIISGKIDIGEPDNRPYYMKPVYSWDEKLKYSPLHVDTVVMTGAGGLNIYYKYKPCIYVVETKNEIQISYTSYVESNLIPWYVSEDLIPEGYYYDRYFGAVRNLQNDFNQDYLSSYVTDDNLKKDTIVYKTNKVVFTKR